MTNQVQNQITDPDVYKTLLESTKAIPWKIDWATMRFSYIGPQIEKLLGWTAASWVSAEDWVARMHPEDQGTVPNYCIAQSKAGHDHEADYRALTKNGHYVWIRDVVHVVRNEQGEVTSLIGFMFDISERKKAEEEILRLQKELEHLSFKDGLTDLPNRRMFDSVIELEWLNAKRHRHPLSLILLDIDFFKQYNDCYGHLQGDVCLKQVTQVLSQAVTRSRDLIARFGGEEFVIVLPETDAVAARTIAERCQHLIQQASIPHEKSEVAKILTISQGVNTIIPSQKDDLFAFIEKTDQQLYQAKLNGRNLIV